MNKKEMKKLINKEFGFAQNKIILIDACKNQYSKTDYVEFKVCNIKYLMYFDYGNEFFRLMIWRNPKIDK